MQRLFMQRRPAMAETKRAHPVIYVHGGTFPSGLAVAWTFREGSWLQALANAGFDAWAFDFAGFGGSDRYPEMSAPPAAGPPKGRAVEAADQVVRVIDRVVEATSAQVSLVAHSWGTMPAALAVARRAAAVRKLVMFAPITRRGAGTLSQESAGSAASVALPAWRLMTRDDQWQRFVEDVAAGEPAPIDSQDFEHWIDAYIASDREGRPRHPPSVKIPMGPIADIMDAWSGSLAYEPAIVTVPTLIVRGENDRLTTEEDVAWLRGALTEVPALECRTLSGGGHMLHLERPRKALWELVNQFLGS